MKRAYYYFLFRIFRFYKDKYKYNDKEALFGTICLSTTCVFVNLFTVYAFFNFFDILPMFSNKYLVIPIMVVIGICNYLLFIKDKKFLKYGFTKNKIGTIKIIAYYVISLAVFIVIANFNRQKIFSNTPSSDINTPKKESLEGKIRDWIKDL